jgi:hypothetical protein
MEEYFVQEKSGWDRLLDFLVFVAVFVVTIFLILELLGYSGKTGIDPDRVNEIYFWLNLGVFAIFIMDLIRLWRQSATPGEFFGKNWLDVLATIPFELIAYFLGIKAATIGAFGLLKLVRAERILSRVARISKISKEFKAASHLKRESEEYKKKHRI